MISPWSESVFRGWFAASAPDVGGSILPCNSCICPRANNHPQAGAHHETSPLAQVCQPSVQLFVLVSRHVQTGAGTTAPAGSCPVFPISPYTVIERAYHSSASSCNCSLCAVTHVETAIACITAICLAEEKQARQKRAVDTATCRLFTSRCYGSTEQKIFQILISSMP
jgi:hypothetical protein